MCGRFTLTRSAEEVLDALNLIDVPEHWTPRYNIAPTQSVMIITAERPQVATSARWGLIPSWARDAQVGARMINARADSLGERASFREAFLRRRCLVIADGFYEWVTTAAGKTPTYFRLQDHAIFTFAGIWDSWRSPLAVEVKSCAIITTEASEDVAPVHSRMPVFLEPSSRPLWLGRSTSGEALAELLAPLAAGTLLSYPVSQSVNSPATDDPSCLVPAQLELRFR